MAWPTRGPLHFLFLLFFSTPTWKTTWAGPKLHPARPSDFPARLILFKL
jgi:hypothetical protein